MAELNTPQLLNALDLEQELQWMTQLLDTRFKLYFGEPAAYADVFEIEPPDLSASDSPYARFVNYYKLTFAERTTLVLALVPHIRPQLLDPFFTKNMTFDRPFTQFGGIWQGNQNHFIPTGETVAFLLAGDDLHIRFMLHRIFDEDHVFAQHHILELLPAVNHASLQGQLKISDEYLSYFTTGRPRRPEFGANFPAQLIETALTWDDLVLHAGTQNQIAEIETWLTHGSVLMDGWGMAPKLRPGYRALFYGPPGTGKTMTACLLGKSHGRDVYKVDLSLIVSKYIGETEKNLSKVFNQAQHKGWILFFDEADALFGKRGETYAAHDRYANQEVSFLLQRIETFDGIAILASNRRENLDEAFARRFESMIYFPVPRPEERLLLWQKSVSSQARLEETLDLDQLAQEHVLTGGAIMNVMRYASLEALKRGDNTILAQDILHGIRREYAKEGKRG